MDWSLTHLHLNLPLPHLPLDRFVPVTPAFPTTTTLHLGLLPQQHRGCLGPRRGCEHEAHGHQPTYRALLVMLLTCLARV